MAFYLGNVGRISGEGLVMATFDYNMVLVYVRIQNNWVLDQDRTDAWPSQTGTLDDGESDDVFSGNDTFVDVIGGVTLQGDYNGYVPISPGENFVLVSQSVAPGSTGVFFGNPSPGFVPPPSFNINVVNSSPFTVCFTVGTLIATPQGEVTVESLKIGDPIMTEDGREVPVKWIGRQTVHKLFTLPERFAPVRVGAGALGRGLPHTDLLLTANHALILDGIAINAGALINGVTIIREPMESLPERITYYHVETKDHDVILANGAPAETFIDYIGRQVFDNHAEYVDLYGEERVIAEMDLPRVSAARMVPPEIRARLAARHVA
jgi:hypothetical protein